MKARTRFNIITPEGREVLLGFYASPGRAWAAAKRRFGADWLALCLPGGGRPGKVALPPGGRAALPGPLGDRSRNRR